MNATVSLDPDRERTAGAYLSPAGRQAEGLLRQSGYLALRGVACDARDGVITLRGRLPSYYLKQVAQSIAARIEGVRRVVNEIEVAVPNGPAPAGRDRATKTERRFP
jgi:osmotically-inducible protein OsmY